MISLPAAWRRNEIVSVFIAKGWIVFSFAGINPHRIICVQPSKIKPKHKEELVGLLSQGKYHWFWYQMVLVLLAVLWVTCVPRERDVCRMFCSLVPWLPFSTFGSDITQESMALPETGQTLHGALSIRQYQAAIMLYWTVSPCQKVCHPLACDLMCTYSR